MAVRTDSLPWPEKLAYSELLAMPDDGNRYEILDGELAVTPAPTTRHQKISRRLHFILYQAIELTGRGEVYYAPTDVLLDEHTVVEPDLLVVLRGGAASIEERYISGPPDLVIEILSPSTRRRDVLAKATLYARFGVPHYWQVDPEVDRIELLALRDGAYETVVRVGASDVVRPDAFAGVVIPLAEIFAD